MKSRTAVINFIAFCAVPLCRGHSAAQTYATQNFGAEAGVATATAIALDVKGTLVVGTNDGLLRFDGFDFEPLVLPGDASGRIARLTSAADGSVWVLVYRGGLFRLDAHGGITRFEVPADLEHALMELRSQQRLRVDAEGHVWINEAASRLWHLDPFSGGWTHIDPVPGERIVDFYFEGRESLWVATRERVGRLSLSIQSERELRWTTGLPEIVFLRPHSSGKVWVGTRAGIYLLDDRLAVRQILSDSYAAWWHAEPAIDGAGRLLLSVGYARGPVRRMGVLRLAADGALDFPRGPQPGLHGYTPRQLLFGNEGDFWLAHDGGIIHIEQEYLTSYPLRAPDGTIELAKQLMEDTERRELYISTWGGMYRLRNHVVERLSLPTRRATTHAVMSRDGSSWWMEHDGLGFALVNGKVRSATERSAHLVFETRNGTRFVARPDGLYRETGNDAVKMSSRRFIAAPAAEAADGRVWVSVAFHGIDTIEGDSLASECRACVDPSIRSIVSTLRDIEVDEMRAGSDGRVWIAAGPSGLICLAPQKNGVWAAHHYNSGHGLLNDEVAAVAPTDDGRLWLGTRRGLLLFRVRAGEPDLEPLLELRARDGLPGEAVSAVLEGADGIVWVGSSGGQLHRLEYRNIPTLPSPSLRIARLETNGISRQPGPKPLRFRSDNARIAIQLAPRSYRQVSRLDFHYRLVPLDTSWSSLGSTRSVQIAGLPPGRHVFEARTVRPGRPPGPILRQELFAVTPIYRRWWFVLTIAGMLLMPPALWYRLRLERQLAMERLRARIATDLHDDLGAGLTQVSLYSELIRRASEPQVAAWAERVGEQARSLSEGMRDIIWAVDPQRESWDALELRMKDHAAELLSPHGIAFVMNSAGPRAVTLSAEIRRNVLFVFKEAIHNAVRHARCRRIEVQCRLSPRRLRLTIRDDGQGFDLTRLVPGNGLRNLQRRAAEMGAVAKVDSAPGLGTTVELDVPL